jgi:hypothetical protein
MMSDIYQAFAAGFAIGVWITTQILLFLTWWFKKE